MIATALKRTEGDPTPFSSSPRGVHIGHLEADAYYTFNFDSPDGVRILRGPVAQRFISLVGNSRQLPLVDHNADAIDLLLVKHGLARVKKSTFVSIGSTEPHPKRMFSIWLHVVNGCNFRCYYCYIPELKTSVDPNVINQHSITPLTSDLIAERLVEYAHENGYDSLHIKFAGGEPTLNANAITYFCETILDCAEGLQVSFGMISNGSFASETIIPILQQYKISISLSVDGFHSTHDTVRFEVLDRHKVGSWDKLESNIDQLQSSGITPYILYTMTRLNADSLISFADWSHARGMGFRLSPVRQTSFPSSHEMNMLKLSVSQLYVHLGDAMPTSLNFGRDARFAEWNLKKKKLSACGSCRNYIAIAETGDIKPCQMSPSQGISIQENSIGEAMSFFSKDPSTALIASPGDRRGACTRCEYFHVCTGGCPQHTASVYGTVEHPSVWCDLFGTVMPIYIKAKAKHMWRQLSELEVTCPLFLTHS